MATTTNFGWSTPDDTGLVKDGASAIRTLGSAIDTSLVKLKGGTTGQVLAKASNTDLDYVWSADASGISPTIVDAKGDLIAGTANDTVSRLAVGTNGQILSADSTAATGLKWIAAPAASKILQVVTATNTGDISTTSSSYTDSGLSLTITPSSNTNKILIFLSCPKSYVYTSGSSTSLLGNYKLLRGTTSLEEGNIGASNYSSTNSYGFYAPTTLMYLDSPATTSATTYKIQISQSYTTTYYFSGYQGVCTLTAMEVSA